MYGLIGKIDATAGERDDLIDILLKGTGDTPGCLSYVSSPVVTQPVGGRGLGS